MQTRSLLFAVTLFSLCACQDNLTEQKATWEAATKGWATKLDEAKKGHEALLAKMKDVPEAHTDALKAEKADFEKRVATGGASITAAQTAVDAAKASMDKLMAQGKKVPVEVALSNTVSSVDGVVARAASFVSAANSDLETLKKSMEGEKKAGDAAAARTAAWTAETKKKGGPVPVEHITFAGSTIEVDKSKDSLDGLATALKSCAELKVELLVVAVGEEADLGSKRAEALKAHLTANGVNAASIAKAGGSVVKEGEELISFTVVSPCK